MAAKFKKETSHNVDFAEGGDTHMFGEGAANPEKAGVTRKDSQGSAPGAKYAEGGKGKMFGFQPSNPQSAGRTSSY